MKDKQFLRQSPSKHTLLWQSVSYLSTCEWNLHLHKCRNVAVLLLTNSSCGHPGSLSETHRWQTVSSRPREETDETCFPSCQEERSSHLSFWVELEARCAWRRETGSEMLENNPTVKRVHVCKWAQYSQVLQFSKEALENTETSDKFRDTQTAVVVKLGLCGTFILNFLIPGLI